MKKKFLIAGACGLVLIVLSVLLHSVDVASIGPNGSVIGLSSINGAVFGFFGVSDFWNSLTDLLLIASGLVAGLFVGKGVYQFIKRKMKIKKLNKEYLLLAALYVAMAVFYLLFEKIAINYRPVFEPDGTLEPSFPSTHTLISCVVAGSGIIMANICVKTRPRWRNLIKLFCGALIIVTPLGRIFAGQHWLTDVLGGYLLSAMLVFAFWGALDYYGVRGKNARKN